MRAWLALVVAACSGPRGETPHPAPGSGSAPMVREPPPPDAPEASQEERLAAIQLAMNTLDEAAQACWASVAVERFDIEGEIAATIDIAPTSATVSIARDTTRNPKLVACLTRVLVGFHWAPPLYGQAIQLPFKFRAPDGQNVIDRALVPWQGQSKLAVAVLLDENNSNNDKASMFEVALAPGGSTGARIADRPELWYFLGPAAVQVNAPANRHAVAAGDMMYVPAQAARDVMSTGAEVHAMVVMVPGGREGSARAGALPTRELGAIKSGVAGPVYLPASAAKTYPSFGLGNVTIFAEPATIKDAALAGSLLVVLPQSSIPEHVHAKETELLYILSGTGTMTVDGVALNITPTSVVQIPPNVKHSFRSTSEVRAIQIYTPAGPEQRFKAKP
jgi:quercetin dioxygenase-like cupin family protein